MPFLTYIKHSACIPKLFLNQIPLRQIFASTSNSAIGLLANYPMKNLTIPGS